MDTSAEASAPTESPVPAKPAASEEPPDRGRLSEIIGEEKTDKLIAQIATSPDAAWIAAHPDAYGIFRPHIQRKALRLAADEPLATPFVRGMPSEPEDAQVDYAAPALDAGSPSPDAPSTDIPHLYQWDKRWGYTMYDGDSFGMSGCAPTALAMVYQGLTGKSDLTPYDMGRLAFAGGFVSDSYGGTRMGYIEAASDQIGLHCEVLEISADAIVSALADGRPVIAHVAPGTFTRVGHYLVLPEQSADGQVVINDPYSVANSGKLWNPALIASESRELFAFSLA